MLAAQCITWGKAALTNLHLKGEKCLEYFQLVVMEDYLDVTLVWSGGHLLEMVRGQIVYFEPKLSQISEENVINLRCFYTTTIQVAIHYRKVMYLAGFLDFLKNENKLEMKPKVC